jgi:hypothetical protein
METGLSRSAEMRAVDYIIEGMEPLEAVKQAILDENKLIAEMLEQKTERSKKALNQIMKNVYGLSHILN